MYTSCRPTYPVAPRLRPPPIRTGTPPPPLDWHVAGQRFLQVMIGVELLTPPLLRPRQLPAAAAEIAETDSIAHRWAAAPSPVAAAAAAAASSTPSWAHCCGAARNLDASVSAPRAPSEAAANLAAPESERRQEGVLEVADNVAVGLVAPIVDDSWNLARLHCHSAEDLEGKQSLIEVNSN